MHTSKSPEKLTSLDDYISRMKSDQTDILYIAGARFSILCSALSYFACCTTALSPCIAANYASRSPLVVRLLHGAVAAVLEAHATLSCSICAVPYIPKLALLVGTRLPCASVHVASTAQVPNDYS